MRIEYIFIILLILYFIYNCNYQYGGLNKLSNVVINQTIDLTTTDQVKLTYTNNNFYLYEKNIDNVNLSEDQKKILIKNQINYSENGIYKIIDIDSDYCILEKQTIKNINNILFNISEGNINKNTQWNIYYNIYNNLYQNNHLIFKESKIYNNVFDTNHHLKTKFWFDSKDITNVSKPYFNSYMKYNNINNHIFSNNGLDISINKANNNFIKSLIVAIHSFDDKLYIIQTKVKSSFIKLFKHSQTCSIIGINKLIINNGTVYTSNDFTIENNKKIFKELYDKPIILYVELDYEVKNIYINKTLSTKNKTTGYIYEVKVFNKFLDNPKDNINSINSRLKIYDTTQTSNIENTDNLICFLDGNNIKKYRRNYKT